MTITEFFESLKNCGKEIQVRVNVHNLPLKDFIEMSPNTCKIFWLDNSESYSSGFYCLKTFKPNDTEFDDAEIAVWSEPIISSQKKMPGREEVMENNGFTMQSSRFTKKWPHGL